jgi:hypothetical protein
MSQSNHNGKGVKYTLGMETDVMRLPEREKHIGWIGGHCSDPMNCPACKSGGDKPRAGLELKCIHTGKPTHKDKGGNERCECGHILRLVDETP